MSTTYVKREPGIRETRKANINSILEQEKSAERTRKSIGRHYDKIAAQEKLAMKKKADLGSMNHIEELQRTGAFLHDLAADATVADGNPAAIAQGFFDYYVENAFRMSPQGLRRFKQYAKSMYKQISDVDARFRREEREEQQRERDCHLDCAIIDFVVENYDDIQISGDDVKCSDSTKILSFCVSNQVKYREIGDVKSKIILLYQMMKADEMIAELKDNKKIGEKMKS